MVSRAAGRRRASFCVLNLSVVLLAGCDSVFPSVEKANSADLREVVDRYIRAQQAEDRDAAYGVLCPAGREDRDDFDARVRQTADDIGRIQSWRISTADELSNGRGVVRYAVTTETGTFEREVDLERDSGDWCVSNLDDE
jgi:hypothetical protein